MLTMATKNTRHYFQTLEPYRKRYAAWMKTMTATRAYEGKVGTLTSDYVGNALFLWAMTQNSEVLAKQLEPFLDEYREVWLSRQRVEDREDEKGADRKPETWLPGAVPGAQTDLAQHPDAKPLPRGVKIMELRDVEDQRPQSEGPKTKKPGSPK